MELSKEEKEAKLELNRFIYGKQLRKDDIVDYLGILFNLIDKQQKEINKAIEYIENAKKELYGCGNYYLSDLLNILKGELNE